MTNPLYELTRILQPVSAAEAKDPFSSAIAETTGLQHTEARFFILGLFDESIDAFLHTGLSEDRTLDMISQLKTLKNKFLQFSYLSSCGEIKSQMQLATFIPLLNSFGDTVASSTKASGEMIDRKALQDRTSLLLDDLKSAELPQYAKDVLELKLKALICILNECAFYTDGEIRMRVKGIFADYCAEFKDNDKMYATISEKMLAWAKPVCGAGIFAL